MKYTIKQNGKITSDYCNHLPKEKPLYAVAYTNRRIGDYYEVTERRKPIKGVLTYMTNCGFTRCVFIPLNRKGEYVYHKATAWHNYMYCDTYKEAVELYNSLVKERIDILKGELKATYKDFIKPKKSKKRRKKERNLKHGKEEN